MFSSYLLNTNSRIHIVAGGYFSRTRRGLLYDLWAGLEVRRCRLRTNDATVKIISLWHQI